MELDWKWTRIGCELDWKWTGKYAFVSFRISPLITRDKIID